MKLNTFFAALVLSLVTVSIAALFDDEVAIVKRQIPVRPCSTGVHVIAASGDGQVNIGGYGLLKSLADQILNRIPDSTNVTLPYPKADTRGVYKTEEGARNLVTYIQQYHQYCPTTKIVLLGYSAGAIITMNTLCGGSPAPWAPTQGLPGFWTSTIIGTVIYGDETRTGGQPYNYGTCDKWNGKGWFPRTNPAGCAAFTPFIRSYCDTEDPNCCSGGDISAHYVYPGKYDGVAADFVVNRYYWG